MPPPTSTLPLPLRDDEEWLSPKEIHGAIYPLKKIIIHGVEVT